MKARLIIFFFAATICGAQQTAFEAAAIKPSDPNRRGGGISMGPARIRVINSPLTFCVEMAWNVKEFQVTGGTGWMNADRYDIDAVAAAPFKNEEFRTMMQALLADRFGLVIHHTTQERQGYALVVGKNGAKLPAPVEDQSFLFSRTPTGDVTVQATSASMERLASALSSKLGITIVDKTGIEGKYNVSMQYTPEPGTEPRMTKDGVPIETSAPDAPGGPSIFNVLQEKFGLKLEPRKVPVDVIVIDRAHRPTEN